MRLGVDLSKAGVPGCDHVIKGETKDEVLAAARDHLSSQHGRSADNDLMNVIASLIGPIKK